ncbi:MAG: oligosaccharide flippase family protein [Candidatus Micrarchaeales archaeon]
MNEVEQESIGRRATRTFFASVVGKVLALIITTATFIAVARLLGPSSYGIYTIAIGYAALIGAVSHFGIASYFDRNISSMSYRKDMKGMSRVISNGYAVIVPIAVALALVGIALSGWIASSFLANSGIQSLTLVLISIDLLFATIWGTSYSALIGLGRGKLASISLVALGLIQLVVGVGLIYTGYGVNGAIVGLLVGDFFGFAIITYYTHASLKRYGKLELRIPKIGDIRETLGFALPLAGNNFLLIGVVSFGTLFLSTYAPNYIVGNYGTALKGLGMMNVIYGTLAIVLIQAFSTVISVRKKHGEVLTAYNKTIAYSLLLNLPIIVFVGVFATPLVYIFLTAKYSLAPLYLIIIAAGTSFMVMNSFTQSFYIASGKVNALLKMSLAIVIVELVSMFILVPRFTATGAIVTLYIIGNIATFILYVARLRKDFGIRPDFRKILNLFVCNIVMAMLLSTILLLGNHVAEIVVGLIGMIVIYPPLLVIFRAVDGEMLKELDHLVAMIPVVGRTARQLDRYMRFFLRIFDIR